MALPFPQATISTGCQVDTGDGPGGVGSRFFGPGEDVLSRALNRAPWALVQNDEYLDNIIAMEEKAYNEVAVLTGFAGGSIGIDPSGGAGGDINYSGSLYLGEASWAGAGRDQEFLETLFQVLDEDYNEVLVDGVEVKVTALVGNALGDEFVNTLTTLTLNKTLPSANYRVVYCPGSTYENLPQYAFVRADVRGLQEVAGEAGKLSVYVLDPSSTPAYPADFKGPTCLQDAIAALGDDVQLFLRNGAYTVHAAGVPGSQLQVSNARVRIVGESKSGVILNLQSGHDLWFDSYTSNTHLENLRIVGDSGQRLFIEGGSPYIKDVQLNELRFDMDMNSGGNELNATVLRLIQTGSVPTGAHIHCGGTGFHGGVFEGCEFRSSNQLYRALDIENGYDLVFRNCFVNQQDDDAVALAVAYCERVSFEDCLVKCQGPGYALLYGDMSGVFRVEAAFRGCHFQSDTTVVSYSALAPPPMAKMSFEDCRFENTSGIDYNDEPVFKFVASTGTDIDVGIIVDNCYFKDSHFEGTGGIGPSARSMLIFGNAHVRRITVDRDGLGTFFNNGAWIEIYESKVDGLNLFMDCSGSLDTTATDDGFIKVLGDSELRMVEVSEMQKNFAMPLLYLEGRDVYSDSGEVALVDGVRVYTTSGVALADRVRLGTTSPAALPVKPLLAELRRFATLRRLIVSEDFEPYIFNSPTYADRGLGYVLLSGSFTTVERCSFRLPSEFAAISVIALTAADSVVQNQRVLNNYIDIAVNTMLGHYGSIWASKFIASGGGATSNQMRNMTIEGNYLERGGGVTSVDTLINLYSDGYGAAPVPVWRNGVFLANVIGNHCVAVAGGSPGLDEFISLPQTELPAATLNCGGSNAIGNTLNGTSASVPSINTAAGHSFPSVAENVYATNL